jgi:hypothetical protein
LDEIGTLKFDLEMEKDRKKNVSVRNTKVIDEKKRKGELIDNFLGTTVQGISI